MVRMLGQVGPSGVRGQPVDQPIVDADGLSDTIKIASIATVEIDPQELPILEGLGELRLEADFAVPPSGVVQARSQAGRSGALPSAGRLRGTQRTRASSVTAAIATIAVPYWRTLMARSARGTPRSRADRKGRSPTMSLSIDVLFLQ
jgi:hypothetical protein